MRNRTSIEDQIARYGSLLWQSEDLRSRAAIRTVIADLTAEITHIEAERGAKSEME